MKAFSIFLFCLFISFQTTAQPGPDVIFPTNIHLNDYPSFSRQVDENGVATDLHFSLLGVITLDTCADLSIIPQLKQEKHLSLKIDLPQIPEDFNGFHHTESLELIDLKDSTNISFLSAFPNLKALRIKHCGVLLFDEYLRLDSLRTLDISASQNLTHLEAFEKLTSLKEISLRNVPQLQRFPAFDPENSIRKVYIYFEAGDGCTNCPPNPNQGYQYSNTNYLLLRRILDDVLGYHHHEYIRESILKPLQLEHTFFSLSEVNLDEVMSGYYVGYEEDCKARENGMLASAEDVGKFIRALNNGTVFNEGEQEIYPYEYSHGGLVVGYQSLAEYHADIDAVVVQFINTTDFEGYEWNLSEISINRIVDILRKNSKAKY